MSFPYLENEDHKKSVPIWTFLTSVSNLNLLEESAHASPEVRSAIGVIRQWCPTIPANQTPGTYSRIQQTKSGLDLVHVLLSCANFNPSLADTNLSIEEGTFQSQMDNSSAITEAVKLINVFVDKHFPSPSPFGHSYPRAIEDNSIRRHKMLVKNVRDQKWTVHSYGHFDHFSSGVGFVLYTCSQDGALEGFLTPSGELSATVSRAKSYESAEAAMYSMRNHNFFSQFQIVEVNVSIKGLGQIIECSKGNLKTDLSAGSLPQWMAEVQRRDLEEALKNHSKEEILARWEEANKSQIGAPDQPKRRM